MNFGALIPPPNIAVNRPVKVSPRGNLYKIQSSHTNSNDNTVKNYEIWTTKEAVQKHFNDTSGEPQKYQLKQFARQMYEKQMRSHNGSLPHKGILVTSDSITHGDPRLWPHILNHPEIKM